MDYNLINGAFEAKLPGLTKLVLLGMLWHRNDQTGCVWVSQETLAKELGISYNTVARAVDKLEKLKVLVYIGEMPLNPGCVGRSTHIYEIDLKPLGFVPSRGRDWGLMTSPGTNGSNWSPLGVSKDIQSGVGVGSVSKGESSTSTVPYSEHSSTREDQEPNQPPRGTQKFSEEEIDDLVTLWEGPLVLPMSPTSTEEAIAALRSFNSPVPAATLAVDMWWAFRTSDYWSKPGTWKAGQTMENFLGAWPTISRQFAAWRNNVRGKFIAKFPTVKSLVYHLEPSLGSDTMSVSHAFELEEE